MRERGFFTDPLQELQHLNATLFRACRIIVDTSLHLGEMSFDQALRFMIDKAAMPEAVARYLAARGVQEAAKDAPVDVIRDFHDTITSSGSLPLGLAERAVLASVPKRT